MRLRTVLVLPALVGIWMVWSHPAPAADLTVAECAKSAPCRSAATNYEEILGAGLVFSRCQFRPLSLEQDIGAVADRVAADLLRMAGETVLDAVVNRVIERRFESSCTADARDKAVDIYHLWRQRTAAQANASR